MTDIDAQVAQFAADLEHLSGVNAEVQEADIAALTLAIITAAEDRQATSALIKFGAAHKSSPEYSRSVILSAVSRFAIHVAVAVPTWRVSKMAGRLSTLALACRILDLGEVG